MTYAVPKLSTRPTARVNTVDIAGTAWPVYKVEALVLGMLVFVGALAFTASLQVAVLSAAAAAVAAWWGLKAAERFSTLRK
ncbi:hypothetical protein [Rhodococcoides yunnanense]|uniref:hypothetical protein n=1 Tax=Rhodococcoides yunnanense TaxID=278209 RepID=UPI000934D7F7|nr:hypothetical protein [Rhodococcus yunnanensis]